MSDIVGSGAVVGPGFIVGQAAATAPIVVTTQAEGLTATSAALHGEVGPGGLPTNGFFQWGLTTSYGNTTANQPVSGPSGPGRIGIAQVITGLTPSTTYHFRAVAVNSEGTTLGADETFTTQPEFVSAAGRVRVREHPPLQLIVSALSPSGVATRWASDDPDAKNIPKGLNFGSVMPGGYDRFGCTLQRDAAREYPDLARLSKLTILGVGGTIAWQGRLEKVPDTTGYQAQSSPEGVGFQSVLEDDQTAREIYVDQEQSRWGAPSTPRKLFLLNAGYDYDDPSQGEGGLNPGEAATSPSIITALNGPWARARISEAWYDAKGVPIGYLYYAWFPGATVTASGFEARAALASDQAASEGVVDAQEWAIPSFPGGVQSSLFASLTNRAYAILQLFFNTAAGEAKIYPIFFPIAAVYGRHGLTLYGTNNAHEAKGVLSSDVEAHAVSRWAPMLKLSTGSSGTIRPSNFVIPQLAFLDPTTVAEIVKQATRFELRDWAVWDGPTYYSNARGARGNKWRSRVGPSQLQEAGSQITRLWNGVAVQYQDVSGEQQVVGPPGMAGVKAEGQSTLLLDADPENPLNKLGEKKWALLRMGTSTAAGAIQLGQIFLRESRQLEGSGQATIIGSVEDTSGNRWPAWSIKAGDQISFMDASDSSYRRIVSVSYDDSSRSNTLQLDQPPEGLQALLERLSVVLIPLGIS